MQTSEAGILRVKLELMQFSSNENKMSDGGRDRALLGVEVWKSSQKWSVQRSAVRSIAWLDAFAFTRLEDTSSD